MSPSPVGNSRGFFTLLKDLPDQLVGVVKAEANAVKADLLRRLRLSGEGLVFFVLAFMLVSLTLQAFVLLVMFLLAVWLPLWIAALIVTFVLLVFTVVLVLVGLYMFTRLKVPSGEKLEAERFISNREAMNRRHYSDRENHGEN